MELLIHIILKEFISKIMRETSIIYDEIMREIQISSIDSFQMQKNIISLKVMFQIITVETLLTLKLYMEVSVIQFVVLGILRR
jgi:hypothetical protein